MTTPSAAASFGFAAQPAKIGTGTFTVGDRTWHRLAALDIQGGLVQRTDQFPPEIGDIIPQGAYKQGVYYAQSFDFLPRAHGNLGYLLYALMGNVSSVTGKDVDGVSATNVNTHIFNFNPTTSWELPWLAMRTLYPGTGENLGVWGYDGKIGSLRLVIPAAGKMMATMDYIGCRTEMEEDPTWTWDETLEDGSGVPESCVGTFAVGTTSPTVTGVTIEFSNQLTGPREETVVGSYFLDDIVCLYRTAIIRSTWKWNSPDDYQQFVTNSTSGTTWNSTPYRTQTSGADFAFKGKFDSPMAITDANPARNNSLIIRANDVTWIPTGPPRLQAGGLMFQEVIGTVQKPASGDYLQLILQNGETAYAWT